MKHHTIWLLIFIGVIATSSASTLIRLCQAPALVIASYRLAIAASIFMLITAIRYGSLLKPFSATELRLAALSGACLCVHFATWITSLSYTSVASSVVLVQTAPIFVAFGSLLFLKEKPPRLLWLGILITICGGVLISLDDVAGGRSQIKGDVLAVAGAIALAAYWLTGRRLRAKIGILHYASVVYGIAAILLILLAAVSGATLYPYPKNTLIYLFLIALLPQLLGHTSFNYGLRFLSAPVVSVLVLGEPVGATILAYTVLDETVSSEKIIGGIIILCGVYLTARSEHRLGKYDMAAKSSINAVN